MRAFVLAILAIISVNFVFAQETERDETEIAIERLNDEIFGISYMIQQIESSDEACNKAASEIEALIEVLKKNGDQNSEMISEFEQQRSDFVSGLKDSELTLSAMRTELAKRKKVLLAIEVVDAYLEKMKKVAEISIGLKANPIDNQSRQQLLAADEKLAEAIALCETKKAELLAPYK